MTSALTPRWMIEEKRGPGRPRNPTPVEFDALSEPEKILYTYKDGGFDSAVCRAIEISRRSSMIVMRTTRHSSESVSFGRTICQAWWEDKYREAANGNGKLNASMLNFAMKNMFGWAEKSETTSNDLLSIEGLSRDEAMQKLRQLGPNVIELLEARKKA
jgi:hypothetical protein